MDIIETLMNDDIREQVHRELAPCTPLEFLYGYTCLELGDIGKQFDDPTQESYEYILKNIEDVTEEYNMEMKAIRLLEQSVANFQVF